MNGGRLNASISANGGAAFGASLVSTGTMNLVAGSNITLSQAGANISFQAPNAHNVSFGGNVAGAAAMVSTGTLSLYGGSNITLSQNANNVTINGPAAGGGASINFSAGTTSSNLASVRFADSNGVGFGLNGSIITASYTQSAMFDAGVSTMGNTAGATGTNTNGLFLAGSNNITLSQSLNTNGATVSILGPTFANANNVSLGISSNGVVTGSASFSQSVQTQSNIQAISAAGGVPSTGTVSFANSNNMVFGMNGNVMTASANVAGGGGVGVSAGGSSQSTGTISFSNANGVAFGLNNGSLTASYTQSAMFDAGMLASGNSAGTAGANTNGLYFVGGNNITLSQSTDAATGATITINGPAAGGGGGTLSNWEPMPFQYGQISASQKSNAFIYFYKLQPGAQVSASRMLQLINMSMTLSSNSSYAGGISIAAGIYSANGSTLSLMNGSSGSQYYQFTNSASNSTSVLSGNQGLTLPLNMNISPGNYWLGMWSRTTFTNAAWFAPRNMVFTVNTGVYGGLLGVASNATEGLQEGVGYVTVSSATLPTSMPISSIYQSQFVSNAIPYINFKNMTF